MKYKKLRKRYKRHQEDEQFHISFSDLFAGMIGVIMIFIVFFYSSIAMSNKLNVKPTFEEAMESNITRIQNGADSSYELIYSHSDHIYIASIKKTIPLNQIETSKELQKFLIRIYAKNRKMLSIVSGGNHLSTKKLYRVLYRLSKNNKKMIEAAEMYQHKNCEFYLNEKMKKECLEKWGDLK